MPPHTAGPGCQSAALRLERGIGQGKVEEGVEWLMLILVLMHVVLLLMLLLMKAMRCWTWAVDDDNAQDPPKRGRNLDDPLGRQSKWACNRHASQNAPVGAVDGFKGL